MRSSVQKKLFSIFIFLVLLVYGVAAFADEFAAESWTVSDAYVGLEASYVHQETEEPKKLTIALIATDGFGSVTGFQPALQTLVWAAELKGINVEVLGPIANTKGSVLYPEKNQTEFGTVEFKIASTGDDSQSTNKHSLLKLQKKEEQILVLLGQTEPIESKADWIKEMSKKWATKNMVFVALQPDATGAETFVTNVAPFLLPPEPEAPAEENAVAEEPAEGEQAAEETVSEAEAAPEESVPEAESEEENPALPAQLVMMDIPAGKDCLDFLLTDVLFGTDKAIVLKDGIEGNTLYFSIPYSQISEPLLYVEADQISGGVTLTAPDGKEYLILGSEDIEAAAESNEEETGDESEEAQTASEEQNQIEVLKSRTILCDAIMGEEDATEEAPTANKGLLIPLPEIDPELVDCEWKITASNAQNISARLYCIPAEKIDNNIVLTSDIKACVKAETAEGEVSIEAVTVNCIEDENGLVIEPILAKNQPIAFAHNQESAKLEHFLLMNEDASVKATLQSDALEFEPQQLNFDGEGKTYTIPQINKAGDYYVTFELVKGEEVLTSQVIRFSVENNSPKKITDVETKLVCWEILENHTQVIDLNGKYTDPDVGDVLRYDFELEEDEPLKYEFDAEKLQLKIVFSGTPSDKKVVLKIVVNDGDDKIEEKLTLEYLSLEEILNELRPAGKPEEKSLLRNTKVEIGVSLLEQQEEQDSSTLEFIKENLRAECKIYRISEGKKGEQIGEAIPLTLNKESLNFNGEIILPNEEGQFAVYVTLKMDNDRLEWNSEEFKLDSFECYNNPPKISQGADVEPQKHIVQPGTEVTYDISDWPKRAYDDEGEKVSYVLQAERKEKKEWVAASIDENGYVHDEAGQPSIFTAENIPERLTFSNFGTYRITFRAQDDLGSTSKESVSAEIRISNLYVLIGIIAIALLMLIVAACITAYILKPAYASDDSITLSLTDETGTETHTVELHSLKKKMLSVSTLVPMFHEKPMTLREWNALKRIVVKPGKEGIIVLDGKKKLSNDETITICETVKLTKKKQKTTW